MAKFTVSMKSCCNLKTLSLLVYNPTAESVNCSLFLKNQEKHFCDLTYKKKNFVKHIESLAQYLWEKFIGDNLSIIDIALRIFEIIDYRYRFSTERFIVPNTGSR